MQPFGQAKLRSAAVLARALLLATVVALFSSFLPVSSASANSVVHGPGFDQCTAPSNSIMVSLRGQDLFVNMYVAGVRSCPSQPSIDSRRVNHQLANGWSFIPISIDYQAPCYTRSVKKDE